MTCDSIDSLVIVAYFRVKSFDCICFDHEEEYRVNRIHRVRLNYSNFDRIIHRMLNEE